jgi:heme/copper-type cytochrome/quinol oxidase subunit 2
MSFKSDQPVFVYCSIVDNGSEDPTFVTASADSGVETEPPPPPPPPPAVVTIVAEDFSFSKTESRQLRGGDQVTFRISKSEGLHGFELANASTGQTVFSLDTLPLGNPVERIVTLPAGEYVFFCTNSGCGFGHSAMSGSIDVNQ